MKNDIKTLAQMVCDLGIGEIDLDHFIKILFKHRLTIEEGHIVEMGSEKICS